MSKHKYLDFHSYFSELTKLNYEMYLLEKINSEDKYVDCWKYASNNYELFDIDGGD